MALLRIEHTLHIDPSNKFVILVLCQGGIRIEEREIVLRETETLIAPVSLCNIVPQIRVFEVSSVIGVKTGDLEEGLAAVVEDVQAASSDDLQVPDRIPFHVPVLTVDRRTAAIKSSIVSSPLSSFDRTTLILQP